MSLTAPIRTCGSDSVDVECKTSSVDPIFGKERRHRNIRLYMVTWNVAEIKPPPNLEDALSLSSVPLPDVYGIGLQEVKPVGSDMRDWIEAFTWQLVNYDYVRIKYRQQLGVVTLVFVLRPLLPYCTGFESEITKTGFGGWWGNKGGVSVRLDIFGVNVIIVNCHLAAHQNNVTERISDYNCIIDAQKFKDPDVENILDHDYIFWMGDLNFRLDNMTRDEIDQAIAAKDYPRLVANDQLNRCRNERLILVDFQEIPISFPPSYKFDRGTDIYDTSPKRRLPAWCDRILWYSHATDYGEFSLQVVPVEYVSHPVYLISDHKPVSATFIFTVYDKPPRNPIQFEGQRAWQKNQPHSFRYHAEKYFKTSSSDWIGLYKADFAHFEMYKSFVWALEGAEKNAQGVEVTFPASAMAVKPGCYCLCYMTKRFSLMGMSNIFQVR